MTYANDTLSKLQPGDEVIVPLDEFGRYRRTFVESVELWGVNVIWFNPNGTGPFRLCLPHVPVNPVLYTPISAGLHKSHWAKDAQEIVDDHKTIAKEVTT